MSEIAEQLAVSKTTVKSRHQAGLRRSHYYNDKIESLFKPLGNEAPVKGKNKDLTASLRQRRLSRNVTPQQNGRGAL
jgi:hypothetical protein